VLVVGGGPAGTIAAIAAANLGAHTILIEKNGFLGGNLTAAGIDTIYGLYSVGEKPVKMIGGYPDQIIEKLSALNACYERVNTYGAGIGLTFGVEEMKLVLERMAINAGVQILYHTIMPEVFTKDQQVFGICIASKSGLTRIDAKVFIDATGDADLVARAGGAFEKSGEASPVQSCTAVFFMGNVDLAEYMKWGGKSKLWQTMKEVSKSGLYNLPRLEGSFHATPVPTLIEANMTRIANVDSTDVESITSAEIEGREQVQQYARFLKENVPGFENAYLSKTGSHIGVREGRRVIGEYILTREDVIEGRKFADAIVRCGQPIEDHHLGSDTTWVYVNDFGYYDIPYRCLLPKGLDNVIAAGRCLSASHDAHASARSSGTAMGMGQAAGIASIIALEKDQPYRTIEVSELQANLRSIGAKI